MQKSVTVRDWVFVALVAFLLLIYAISLLSQSIGARASNNDGAVASSIERN